MPTKPHTSKDFNQDLWIFASNFLSHCLFKSLLWVFMGVVRWYLVSLSLISLMSISELPSHGAIIGSRVAADWTALSSFTRHKRRSSDTKIIWKLRFLNFWDQLCFAFTKWEHFYCFSIFIILLFKPLKLNHLRLWRDVTACLLLSSPQ